MDNLIANSDTEFKAEEEVTQAARTQDIFLTTPEANLHVVPNDRQSKKKEKNKEKKVRRWTKKVKFTNQKECHLVPEILPNPKPVFPIQIFSLMTGLKELLELLVEQLNLYAHQNGRNFAVTKKELKAFLGINSVIAINKLVTISEYWRVHNLISSDSIQNAIIRNRSWEILQNLDFADYRKEDKTDRAFKMRTPKFKIF